MKKYVIGIDEAGRGPLAGPVSVGVLMMSVDFYKTYVRSKTRIPKGIDSKKLSEEKREMWFTHTKELEARGELSFSVQLVSAQVIDTKGIVYAIKSAMQKSLKKIGAEAKNSQVLLDGGLVPPQEFLDFKTIIKGDEKEAIIGLASVCAKVTRDTHMKKLAKKYPEYGFEIHKGYGTRAHYAAIKKYGISPEHRKSFLRKIVGKV